MQRLRYIHRRGAYARFNTVLFPFSVEGVKSTLGVMHQKSSAEPVGRFGKERSDKSADNRGGFDHSGAMRKKCYRGRRKFNWGGEAGYGKHMGGGVGGNK